MKFKYYLIANNFEKAIDFYEKVFDAKVEKQNGHHAKMVLFDELTFLIYENKNTMPRKEGYLILRFDDNEIDLYFKVRKKVLESGCHFMIDNEQYRWGTTLSEFTDPFGYNWDLEISNEAINNYNKNNKDI